MSNIERVGDLEVDEDAAFRRKEWSFERWGWIGMLVVMILALLGLFGQGPLSNSTAMNGTFQVGYERFERLLAPAEVQVQVDPQHANNGELRLQVDRDLMSFYNLEQIIPAPDSEELSPDRITYAFKTGQGQEPLRVSFSLHGKRLGIARWAIGVENGPAVDIRQFIYP